MCAQLLAPTLAAQGSSSVPALVWWMLFPNCGWRASVAVHGLASQVPASGVYLAQIGFCVCPMQR